MRRSIASWPELVPYNQGDEAEQHTRAYLWHVVESEYTVRGKGGAMAQANNGKTPIPVVVWYDYI